MNTKPTHVFDPPNLYQAGSPAEEVQHVEEKSNDSLEDGRRIVDEREIVVETVVVVPQTATTEASNPTTPSGIDVSETNYVEEKVQYLEACLK